MRKRSLNDYIAGESHAGVKLDSPRNSHVVLSSTTRTYVAMNANAKQLRAMACSSYIDIGR